jgi:hypothetical protein
MNEKIINEGKTQLENILKAGEVKEVYEITASDGKTYLCERLKTKCLNRTSFDKQPIIKPEQKQKAKENLIKELAKKNLTADILDESESRDVDPDYLYYDSRITRFYTSYGISAYKIKRELI